MFYHKYNILLLLLVLLLGDGDVGTGNDEGVGNGVGSDEWTVMGGVSELTDTGCDEWILITSS